MAMELFAAIAIGSAVTEMKIFQFNNRREMKELDCISTRLNIGQDAYQDGKISRGNTETLCQILNDFKRIMLEYGVTNYKIQATSAFRETRNMMILRDYIEKQTGLKIGVLSNSEQRFVDYKSIASVTTEFESIIQNAAAIVDIGGNSMQISLFDKDKLITTQKIHVGSMSTRERIAPMVKNREHFKKMICEILDHELAGFGKLYQKDRQIKNLIVIGGNVIDVLHQYEKKNRKITSVTRSQFETLYDSLLGMKTEAIAEQFGMAPDQAKAVIPSAIFCRRLIEAFGVENLWLPSYSLCDGIAFDYGIKKGYIRNAHSFDEDIIAASRSISKRYKCSQAHIRNLEEIGLQVYDRMKKIHGMGKRERLLLQIAIILHNCGKFISLDDVSECAYNIIMATEIIGLSHSEREIIAYTVKFNTSSFIYYEDLVTKSDLSKEDYMIVSKLTAILRLVNALDRTHQQKCKNVTVSLKDHELKIAVSSQEDLSLEKGTFEEKADFFEEVFHVHPVFKQKKQM